MSAGTAAGVVVVITTAAMLLVSWRRFAPAIWVSIIVGTATRVVFAAITSQSWTPNDVRIYFFSTGDLVLDGQDPLQHLPGRQWNFLPLMPAIHALEIKTGLDWVYAVKIAPIIADVVLIWLVARLASEHGPMLALQYALNPLSLFVVSLHGQVEPVALALALAGLLVARQDRWGWAGVLVGAAIAAKTWPLMIALAAFPFNQLSRAWRFAAGMAVVPVLALLGGTLFLDTKPLEAIEHLASYSSFVRRWTWSGTLIEGQYVSSAGYDTSIGRVGSVLTAIAAVAVIVVFRDRSPSVRALVLLCASLIVTAGFGVQYLLWPLPLMFALGVTRRLQYTVAAAAWAGLFYVITWRTESYLIGASWLIVAVLAYMVSDIWNGDASDTPDPEETDDSLVQTSPLPNALAQSR